MRLREIVKLVSTIAVMMAVLAVSAAARDSIDGEEPGTAEVTYEVSATCGAAAILPLSMSHL